MDYYRAYLYSLATFKPEIPDGNYCFSAASDSGVAVTWLPSGNRRISYEVR